MATIRLATIRRRRRDRGDLRAVLRGDSVMSFEAGRANRRRDGSAYRARSAPSVRGSCSKTRVRVIGYAYASPHNERCGVSLACQHGHLHRPRASSPRRGPRPVYDAVRAAPRTSAIARRRRASRCRILRASACTKRLDSRRWACIVTSATSWAPGTTWPGIRRRYSHCRTIRRSPARSRCCTDRRNGSTRWRKD